MRTGMTLFEIGLAVGILGVVAGLTFPRFERYRDRVSVEAATGSTMSLLATARHTALRRSMLTAVQFDTAGAVVSIVTGIDTIATRSLTEVHGVTLSASRDSIAFASTGLGFGAANTQLILRRGSAAETVLVSRLGRARR